MGTGDNARRVPRIAQKASIRLTLISIGDGGVHESSWVLAIFKDQDLSPYFFFYGFYQYYYTIFFWCLWFFLGAVLSPSLRFLSYAYCIELNWKYVAFTSCGAKVQWKKSSMEISIDGLFNFFPKFLKVRSNSQNFLKRS